MLTAEGGELWVDFTGTGNASAEGFQLSLLSVPDGLRLLIEAAIDEGKDYSGLDRIAKEIWGYNRKVGLMGDLLAGYDFAYVSGPEKIE